MVNRVVIFTEGGDNIGFGHITRCSALYKELLERKIETVFVVYGKNIEDILKEKNYINQDWKDKEFLQNFLKKDDYVIIDSYLADLNIYEYISSNTSKCMYIDDNNRLKYPKGIILNPVLYEDLEYDTKNPILRGKDYIIVRKEFLKEIKPLEKEYDVLITLGGTDIRNLTPKLIKILEEIDSNFKVAIVIGKAFDNKEEIERLKTEKISLFYNVNASEMRDLILKSKFVICGCGQSINEMLILEANFLPILIADNQLRNYKYLIKIGLFDKVLDYKNINKTIIESLMKKENKALKINKIKNGNNRIISYLLNENNIYFKDILDSSLKEQIEIREWRNLPEVRRYMYNTQIISLEEHLKWINSLKNNNSIKVYYSIMNNEKIGVNILRKKSEDIYEWGLYLNNKVEKGKGIGKIVGEKFLEFVFQTLKINTLEYEVLEGNIPSLRLALKLGLKKYKEEIKQIEEKDKKVLYLKILKNEWRKMNER